ncbi:tetratricopeptide repeat protein [Chryseobacterium sp. CT-SW4]|uniref:tetratricopeptide repeat protein n=1 Tax=Chryseobacterium sp. SW-1 TaxID=3157343 RepID=UPI003B02BA25
MTKILSVLFFFFSYCLSFAQTAQEEQLKKTIYNIPFISSSQKDMKKLDNLISVAKKSNYKGAVALGYLKIAFINDNNNDLEKALYYTNLVDAEHLISPNDSELIFYQKIIQSTIYQKLERYTIAIQKLKEIPQDIKNNTYFNYWTNFQYGNCYEQINDTEKALEYFKNAYQLSKQFRKEKENDPNPDAVKTKINNSYKSTAYLAGIYLKVEKIDSAKIYIDEALKDLKKVDNLDQQFTTNFFAGEIYLKLKNYIKAQEHFWICKNLAMHYLPGNSFKKSVYWGLMTLYDQTDIKDSSGIYSKKILELENSNKKKNSSLLNSIDENYYDENRELIKSNRKLIYILSIGILICLLLIYLTSRKKAKSVTLDKIDTPIINKVEAPDNYNSRFEDVIQLAKQNSPEFLTMFNSLHPDFTKKLLAINSNIKNTELRFCAYLYLNFSTKDIAEYTFTSVRTVQTKKYNIRKKLDIPASMDIYVWFNDLLK